MMKRMAVMSAIAWLAAITAYPDDQIRFDALAGPEVGPEGKKVGERTLTVGTMTIKDLVVAGEMRWQTEVVYRAAPSLSPVEARVVTCIGDTECMTGSVLFGNDAIHLTQRLLADKQGRPLPEPKETTRRWDTPTGPLLLKSTFAVVAPSVLRAPGQITVSYLELPEDTTDLGRLESGLLLRRDPPDRDGNVSFVLFRQGAETACAVVTVTPDGRCICDTNNAVRFVPAK